MDKLVSVIVPVYNNEKYIEKTIDSILNQTYNNFELIVVNDGSTDNSSSVISKFTDSRIKYFFQENSGAPKARNLGFENSSGEYIMFFDADDMLYSNALENLISEFDEETDIVIGNFTRVNDEGVELTKSDFNDTVTNLKSLTEPNQKLKLLSFVDPFPNNKMYKKSFLKENGIKFMNLRIAQDLNFYLQCLGCNPTIKLTNEMICFYRIHENSISTRVSLSILDIEKSISIIEKMKYPLFVNDSSILETLKFNHYSIQLYKIPLFKDRVKRLQALTGLKKAYKKIKYSELDKEFVIVNMLKVRIALIFSQFYASDIFRKNIFLKS